MHLRCVYKVIAIAILVLAALTSCSRQKQLSRDELKSKLQSAASIAAETSTFIDYVGQERATHHYAEGHIEYLFSAVSDSSKELGEALPSAGAEKQLTEGREKLHALATALNQLERDIDRPDGRAQVQTQLATILEELQRIGSSL